MPIATQQELGITKPIAGIDLPKLLAGLEIIAPTRAGTAIASGNLTNGGSIVSEGLTPRLDNQDLEVSFIKVLCPDPSLASAQTTSIPTCKK